MQIGVKLPTSGPFASPSAIRDVAQAAEELGYDSVWLQDHVTRSPSDVEYHFGMGQWDAWKKPIVPDFYEALTVLAWVAGLTSTVRLGTSALVLPFRNPVWLAKEAATIDRLSDGRLVLGVAVGGAYAREELAAIGHQERARRRGKITDEWIDVLRGVWTQERYSLDGEHIKVEEAVVFPKPAQQLPPILVGGTSEAARARVVRKGDGWLAIWQSPEDVRQGVADIAAKAGAAGRSPDEFPVYSEQWLCIDEDRDAAWERSAATRMKFSSYLNEHSRAADDNVAGLLHREDEYSLVGTPDDVRSKAKAYLDAGASHLIMRLIARDIDDAIRSLKLFKSEVAEALL
jgi:probable F420-dependent oxidoreductase